MTTTPLPVVLAGARGHGRWHLDNIRRLQDTGLVQAITEAPPAIWARISSRPFLVRGMSL